MTTEEVYDEQIFPLMSQIIDICKEHSIPLVASFQVDDTNPDVDPFYVSTVLNCDGDEAGAMMHQMAEAVFDDMRRFGPIAPLIMHTYNANGRLESIETIIG